MNWQHTATYFTSELQIELQRIQRGIAPQGRIFFPRWQPQRGDASDHNRQRKSPDRQHRQILHEGTTKTTQDQCDQRTCTNISLADKSCSKPHTRIRADDSVFQQAGEVSKKLVKGPARIDAVPRPTILHLKRMIQDTNGSTCCVASSSHLHRTGRSFLIVASKVFTESLEANYHILDDSGHNQCQTFHAQLMRFVSTSEYHSMPVDHLLDYEIQCHPAWSWKNASMLQAGGTPESQAVLMV